MFRSEGTPRWRAAIAGIAGAALLTLGAGSAALAAPIITEDTGSLTIHKYDDNTQNEGSNDGLEKDIVGGSALEGVEFRVRQVNDIDLSTNAGWVAAAELAAVYNAANPRTEGIITGEGYSFGTAVTETTDGDGEALFPGLPVGLYYVDEIFTPTGVVASSPFLVTIPITHPVDTDAWIYDVNIYPKNSVIDVDKEVQDAEGVQVGDTISYTITGGIPSLEKSDAYRIVDTMHADLTLDINSIVVTIGAVTAQEDVHYTLTPGVGNGGFQIDLTDAGLELAFEEVQAAADGANIVVTYDAVVEESGVITNEALVYPNAPSLDIEPGEPGGPFEPEVDTKWGGITLNKVDSSTGEGLERAVFEVWYSNTNDFDTAQPVLDGTDNRTWETGVDGTVVIDGLRYSNFANGETVTTDDDEYRYYWLVEVQAAEGYELLAQPIGFVVTDQADKIELEVENVPHNAGFELPLTGGTGTVMFTVLGLALLGGAAVWVVARRRNADAQA